MDDDVTEAETENSDEDSIEEVFSSAFMPLFEDRKRQSRVLGFQRHIQFVQWITIIGIAILTLGIPVFLTGTAIEGMAYPLKIMLYAGSICIVFSILVGVYFTLRHHKVSDAEVTVGYLAALDIEKVKNKLSTDKNPINKVLGLMWDGGIDGIVDEMRRTADAEVKELNKKSRLFYYGQFPLFVLGVSLTVITLMARLFSVLF